MTTKKAIEVLIHANKWRRYDDDLDKQPEMPDPKQLGLAIDHAIEIMKRFETIQENPKATMVMDENRFSITVREEDAVISLIEENQSLREKLKSFEWAVEVDSIEECYTDNTFDLMHELYSYNTKLIGTTQTHTLYAIPKEIR